MRIRLFSHRHQARGFSLVETIAAIFVLSVGLPAVAYMYTTALISDNDSSARTQGIYLANSLMNEISVRRYKESTGAPGNGADAGEVITASYSRTAFDDIDDYQQYAISGGWGRVNPPYTEAGVALSDFANYNQYVTVKNINPPTAQGVLSLTEVTAGSTDLKVVVVEVQWMAGRQSVSVSKIFTTP